MRAVVLALFCSVATCIASSPSDTSQVDRKSASTAVMYSFIMPGLGQAYNQSYWKVPLFAGAAVTSGYFVISNQSNFASASVEYDKAIAEGQGTIVTDILLRRREFYRNNRDVAGLALLLTYTLAAVDAYVGANLHDFDVDSNLSLGVGSTIVSPLALNLQVRF